MTPPAEAPTQKLTNAGAHVFDVLLTALFFAYMTWVSYGHGPDVSEQVKWIWAAITSSCVSAVFWLGVQCFRVTLVDQKRRAARGEAS